MKKFIYKGISLFMLAFFMLVSCNDFLDVEPEGKVPGVEFYQTQEDAEEAVVSIYAHLRKWDMVAFAHVIMQEITSDNSHKGSSPGDASFITDYERFQVTPTQGLLEGYWKARYEGIELANKCLDNIPGIEMDANLKARLLNEAKFLRAYFYFDLVRAFGDVPLLTKSNNMNSDNAILVRKPKAEVYAQIVRDLTDALALPNQYNANNVGRITKGAAHGLLAKVYMYMEDWTNVLIHTDTLISSNRYDLEPSFYQLFRIEKENGIESLFEVQASAVAGNSELSGCQYSQVQGVRGEGGFGWGFNIPSDNLAAAFDAAGDVQRKNATILYRGTLTPSGDSILGVKIGDLDGVEIPRYNGKSYVPRSQQVAGVNEGAEQNIRVLRFAEILLIDAEAKIHKGGDVAESLNRVRNRVGLGNIDSPTIQDVWNERRLELAMEGDRFFDLVRTKQAATVLGPNGFKAGVNEVFPIPQKVLETVNYAFEQNPGY